jgi:hypothetical protein
MIARLAAAGLAALTLSACSPGAPEGVKKADLDAAIGDAVGGGACVLIGKLGSGDVVYRFGTHAVCDRALPTCAGAGTGTAADLLKAVAEGKPPVKASCPSVADGSRSVGWAAAPIPGKELAYAAFMEGDHTLPGVVIAEKLRDAFGKAGLQPR